MASIKDLLNPSPDSAPQLPKAHFPERPKTLFTELPRAYYGLLSRVNYAPPATTASPIHEKKSKMPNDSPVFRPGSTQGEVRYPPCEERDEELTKIHKEFQLHPMGKIAQYPRHIPYQSDKKSFQEKTGRDSFHVFQYTFQEPGTQEVWTVMWDYNIGLVRTTHLFKCLGYPKTIPGKALAQNEGLREICHSITGGALAAQGYWWPYKAAKAMAATFCWRIRYALTPLFGTDFPSMCIPPEDQTKHGRMVIHKSIVAEATEIAHLYRDLELQKARAGSNQGSKSSGPEYQKTCSQSSFVYNDQDHRRVKSKFPRHRYEDSIGSARDSSSEPYCNSPRSPTHNHWTPVNGPPRSSDVVTPQSDISPGDFFRPLIAYRKRGLSAEESGSETGVSRRPNFPSLGKEDAEMGEADSGVADVESAGSLSDMSISEDDSVDDDDDYRGPVFRGSTRDEAPGERAKNPPRSARSRGSDPLPPLGHFAHEVKAAHALLHLHMQEAKDDESDTAEAMDWSPWKISVTSHSLKVVPETRKRRCASL